MKRKLVSYLVVFTLVPVALGAAVALVPVTALGLVLQWTRWRPRRSGAEPDLVFAEDQSAVLAVGPRQVGEPRVENN